MLLLFVGALLVMSVLRSTAGVYKYAPNKVDLLHLIFRLLPSSGFRGRREFLDVLMGDVLKHNGIVRIAEVDGIASGWAVAWPDLDDMYVVPEERSFLYISELCRGSGARSRRRTGADRGLRRLLANAGDPHC